MSLNQEKKRLLFGLKLKQIRLDKGFSPLELSQKTGISISYLNEIEKGKKYPKPEKINILSLVLGVNPAELAALEVENKLSALRLLLDSNFIEDIPFDFFGIDPSVLFEMLSSSPLHFSTFVNSISRIGKNYNLDIAQFYYAILKSFQEVHYYYFPEIETEAENFKIQKLLKKTDHIHFIDFLSKNLELELRYFDGEKNKDLKHLRSHFNPKSQVLSVNKSLHNYQKNFIFAREIGFRIMQLKNRPLTYNYVKIKSFEEILNNFKASYFAAAVLIDKKTLIEKIQVVFEKDIFDENNLSKIITSFETTPETFMQRLLTIMLNDFGIKNVAFFKFESQKNGLNPKMVKDLHLNKRHYPQETSTEAYCKRWIAIQHLQDIDKKSSQLFSVQSQFTEYIEEKRSYWHLTVSGKARNNYSLTISVEITNDAIGKIKFLKDNEKERVFIGQTCERCSIFDCKERKSAPTILQKIRSEEAFDQTIKKYF
jgi:XRE family transcriptional regulator, fatty acid utilization regulator